MALFLPLELRTVGFAVSYFMAVATLGVRAGFTYMAVTVAAKTFDLWAISPRVTFFHLATVSASFGLRPNNHFFETTACYLGVRKYSKVRSGLGRIRRAKISRSLVSPVAERRSKGHLAE